MCVFVFNLVQRDGVRVLVPDESRCHVTLVPLVQDTEKECLIAIPVISAPLEIAEVIDCDLPVPAFPVKAMFVFRFELFSYHHQVSIVLVDQVTDHIYMGVDLAGERQQRPWGSGTWTTTCGQSAEWTRFFDNASRTLVVIVGNNYESASAWRCFNTALGLVHVS